MKLTCPHCEYRRTIDPQQIPDGTVQVKCPLCMKSFELPRPELEQEDTEQPVRQRQEEEEPVHQPSGMEFPQSVETPAHGPGSPPSQQLYPLDKVPKAGFWMRVVATLVDAIIVFGLQFLLGSILAVAGTVTTVGAESGAGETAMVVHLFNLVISFTYYIFFTGYNGQTPGKMALRIKVVRRDGSPVGYGRAAFREVPAKFLSGILFGIGYLMVAFDEQKRGLHDRMSDTYVIKL